MGKALTKFAPWAERFPKFTKFLGRHVVPRVIKGAEFGLKMIFKYPQKVLNATMSGLMEVTTIPLYLAGWAIKKGVVATLFIGNSIIHSFKRDLGEGEVPDFRFLVECDLPQVDGGHALRARSGQLMAKQMATLARTFQDTPISATSYTFDTGVGIFGWDLDGALEKRDDDLDAALHEAMGHGPDHSSPHAFSDASMTVQGIWFGDDFIPNGTISGMTPEGLEFRGRWREAPHDYDETEEGTKAAMEEFNDYYDGDGKFWTRRK